MAPTHYNECQECAAITGSICLKRDLQYHLLSKNIQGKVVVRWWPDPPGRAVVLQSLMGFAACVLGNEKVPADSRAVRNGEQKDGLTKVDP